MPLSKDLEGAINLFGDLAALLLAYAEFAFVPHPAARRPGARLEIGFLLRLRAFTPFEKDGFHGQRKSN